MSRNLKYQFKTAIEKSFKPGADKHSAKAQGQLGTNRIYSYSDRNNLMDVASNFSNFMKENHPDVKLLRDIDSNHVQEFLNHKAKNCSQQTVAQYCTKMAKLEQIANKGYNLTLNYSKDVYTPISCKLEGGKVRDVVLSKENYSKIVESCKESQSHGVKGIILSREFGLRVSEITKLQARDIDLEKGVIHVIGSKGGRDRDVPITEQNRAIVERFKTGCTSDRERIVPLKADSVNRFLDRQMLKLGINDSAKTGIHSIRKLYAQERFDEFREQGLTINQALKETSILLGHGEDRINLMQEYVANIK